MALESLTLATITTLKYFWKSSAKPSWKLLVFNAVVGAKIPYGLESLQLLDSDYQRLDAFQQRGLRRILGIPPSHIDRTATNKSVLAAAEKVLSKKKQERTRGNFLRNNKTKINCTPRTHR